MHLYVSHLRVLITASWATPLGVLQLLVHAAPEGQCALTSNHVGSCYLKVSHTGNILCVQLFDYYNS